MFANLRDKIATLSTKARSALVFALALVLVVVVFFLVFGLISKYVPWWLPLSVALGICAAAILWFGPKWQVKSLPAAEPEHQQRKFELENEVRKTIAQILGGLLIVASLLFTAQQLNISQDAQTVAREAQLDAQDAQLTERFTRATEQLASDSLEIRVGGIYAFQRIAENSEEDFGSVYGILQTFVSETAPRNKAEEERPA